MYNVHWFEDNIFTYKTNSEPKQMMVFIKHVQITNSHMPS
jgi:hypothetical protein